MAEISSKSVVVRPAVSELREMRVVLTLDEDEANALYTLLYCRVNGIGPARDQLDKIEKAMTRFGLDPDKYYDNIDSHAHCVVA